MSYPCRCKDCNGRRSLNRKPDQYLRPPKCKHCHGNRWYFDRYRYENPTKDRGGELCKSDCMAPMYGYSFPHKTNTKGCRGYENYVLTQASKATNIGDTHGNVDPNF